MHHFQKQPGVSPVRRMNWSELTKMAAELTAHCSRCALRHSPTLVPQQNLPHLPHCSGRGPAA